MTRIRPYLVAYAIASGILFTLCLYLFLRRGYFDLYIANKAIADTALYMIGLVLLAGTLGRLYQKFDALLGLRKAIGIFAAIFAIIHFLIAFFFLPTHFTLNGFLTRGLIPFVFGLISTITLSVLLVLSINVIIQKINKTLWWKIQYWGIRLAGMTLLAHLVIMKYPGWITWLTNGGGEELARPYLPPGSLIAGTFGIFVLTIRISELTGKKIAAVVHPILFFLFFAFVSGSFVWGIRKTPEPLPLTWKTCTALPGSRIMEIFPPICVAFDGRKVIQPDDIIDE